MVGSPRTLLQCLTHSHSISERAGRETLTKRERNGGAINWIEKGEGRAVIWGMWRARREQER